jgi:hypothetical protein
MREVRFRDDAGMVRVGEWHTNGIEFGGRTYDPETVEILAPSDPKK